VALHDHRPLTDAVRLQVRLVPRGGADRVDGVGPGGELRVRVRAAPVDGAANEALCQFLARELDVAKAAVTLERGVSARLKLVRIDGLTAKKVSRRWPGVTVRDG
jgi:uncharacterized protein